MAALAGAGGAALLLGGDEEASPVRAAPLPVAPGRPPASQINAIYDKVEKGVVSVRTRTGRGGGSGTGFVLDADGTIVTNAHVVEGAEQVQLRFDDNGDPVDARVVGSDPSSDLAVVRVDPSEAPKLQPLVLADSDRVRVGDAAIAIGYPLGLDRTATAGIVSGVGRRIEAPNGFAIDKVIQTDAPINPGNSGGPLLDAQGRVIGVNSQIATAGSQGNVGIGFAVPANTVREVIPRLRRGEQIERAFLGVTTAPLPGTNGAAVTDVTAGSPAARAGVRAARGLDPSSGDVIVSVGGRRVREPDDVAAAIAGREPGERVSIEVLRNGSRQTIDIELGRRPDRVP